MDAIALETSGGHSEVVPIMQPANSFSLSLPPIFLSTLSYMSFFVWPSMNILENIIANKLQVSTQ